MHHSILVEDLAVILCAAGIVSILFQKIKQPAVLGYLIAGFIVGPYTPPFSLIEDEAYLRIIAQLGVIFLMFSLGLEFSFNKITKVGLPAMIIGTIEVVAMIFVGYFTGLGLGWSSYESFLLGAALSISSTTIIIKALEELNLKKEFFAELMVGILLIEDLLGILLLVYISTATSAEADISTYYLFQSTGKLLLVVTSWFLAGYFAIPYLMKKLQSFISNETLTIISIGLCLFLSSIAMNFHYSAPLGAFIMGTILAETTVVHKIETLTLPIRDLFGAVFFVTVGMLIDPVVLYQYFPYVILLSIVTIAGKIFFTTIASISAGQTTSTSLRIGFGMAQIGEFSFIIIGVATTMTPKMDVLYSLIVAISSITTFTTPYLMKFSTKFTEKGMQKLPPKLRQALEGYGKKIARFQPKEGEQPTLMRKDSLRFIINGLIIAIIFTAADHLLDTRFFSFVDRSWFAEFSAWLIVIAIASPFLWAMLFGTPSEKAPSFVSIKVLFWITAWFIFLILLFLDLTFPFVLIPLFFCALLFIIMMRDHLAKIYLWLENHLVTNMSKRKRKRTH